MNYTKGKCEHGLVFNYAGGKQRCGDCGMELITTRSGQRLNTAALEDMYEALKEIKLLCAGSAYTQEVDKQIIGAKCYLALAKAEGGEK